jgi:ketosteroid isomerase-like protein
MTTAYRLKLHRRRLETSSGFRRFFIAALPLFLILSPGPTGCTFQRQPDTNGEGETLDPDSAAATAVIAMLRASAGSWNAGDLDGFMDDYWRSEDLTFSGSSGVTRGWEGLRTRYLESYWAPGAVRDSLSFEDLEVSLLGDETALALGRFVLTGRGEGEAASLEGAAAPTEGVVTSTGFFSLVLRLMDGEWKIVHDHTSEAEPRPEPRDQL